VRTVSTRCQLLFEATRRWTIDGDEHQQTERLLTYKHHDGYPNSVVPLLRRYYRWMPRHDFEYFTATWFYYVKRRYEQRFIEDGSGYAADNHASPMATEALGHNHGVALSYGVCGDGQLHGDINHFYVVDLDRAVVVHYRVDAGADAETPDELVAQQPPAAVYPLAPEEYDDIDEVTPAAEVADGAAASSASYRDSPGATAGGEA
jgi:hypothetical protein